MLHRCSEQKANSQAHGLNLTAILDNFTQKIQSEGLLCSNRLTPPGTMINMQKPSPEEIRKELEHILASPALEASEKRREFLQFVVEETLAGRAGSLKGYTIAVSIFGRDESFDAQSDAVVRVEARRLRRDLDSYYMNAGNGDFVRISIPKGGYTPHFEKTSAEVRPASSDAKETAAPGQPSGEAASDSRTTAKPLIHRKFVKRLMAVTFILAVLVIILLYWVNVASTKNQGASGVNAAIPSVVVLPFKALGSSDTNQHLASGISQELINDLLRFPSFRLYTQSPGFERFVNNKPEKSLPGTEVSYIISGSVLEAGSNARVVAQMSFAKTGEVLWSESYDLLLDPKAMIQIQIDMAGEIATVLGQPYGYIHSDMVSRLATTEVSSMQSYICVLQAHEYRRDFSPEQYAPVLRCLENAIQVDPNYSDAWAMLGWLHLDAGRYQIYGPEQVQPEYDAALQAATRAVELAPDNNLALKALSAINHYLGRYTEGERLARRAVELNPNDPDALVQLGWRLAARGNFEEGVPYIEQAIARTVNPPRWYYHFIALNYYLAGDYAQMLVAADYSAADGSDFSQVLIAIANGALGNRDATKQALIKISENNQLASDPRAYFLRNGATDEIVDALMVGLEQAETLAYGNTE
jgi:TolB-like protein